MLLEEQHSKFNTLQLPDRCRRDRSFVWDCIQGYKYA